MSISINEDHVEEGIGNLIEQFKEKPNLRSYLTALLIQVQEIEDALNEVLTETDDVDIIIGQQLNNIGLVVGEGRFGRNDLQYRTAIKARILLNQSTGTIEVIIALILALQPSLSIDILEFFPASFLATIVTAIDPLIVDINQISNIVKQGKPAGVRALVQFGVTGGKQFDVSGVGFDEGLFGVVLEAC